MKAAYNCAICHQSYIDPANLVKHVEFVHEPELSPEKSSVGLIPKEKDPIEKENVDPGEKPYLLTYIHTYVYMYSKVPNKRVDRISV